MAYHTIEAQHIKKQAIDRILKRMYENIEAEKAGKKISSSHKPKMYLRMARLLAGTDDSVFIDTIDDLLSKNATGDQIKNKLRGISEREIPKGLKRVMSDRLHHGIPLELMDVLMKQEPDVMLEFLQAAEADGRYFGDSRPNVDNSFQEQSHTAAADKATAKYENHPYELKLRGDRRFSAHPDGTNKGFDKALDQVYGSGSEMYDAFKPAIAEAEYALKLGINSDKSRRVVANKIVIEKGIIKPGGDLWDKNTPEVEVIAGRAHLAKREVGLLVAASHNPFKFQDQKDLDANNITQTMIDDWDKGQLKKLQNAVENPYVLRAADPFSAVATTAVNAIKKNPLQAVAGAGLNLDPNAVKSLVEGKPKQAVLQAGAGAVGGALVAKVINGAMRLVPQIAPALKVAGPIGMAYGAYELADAVVEGTTGRKIHQHTEDELNKTQGKDPEYFSQNIGSLMPF